MINRHIEIRQYFLILLQSLVLEFRLFLLNLSKIKKMSNPVFDQLQQKANEAEAIGGTLKFVIDDLTVYVDGTGNSNVVSQEDAEADCTIATSAAVLMELQSGDLNPMMAVMGGKVKISGDMGLAMKVQSLMS